VDVDIPLPGHQISGLSIGAKHAAIAKPTRLERKVVACIDLSSCLTVETIL
jgi:hypothetical protein